MVKFQTQGGWVMCSLAGALLVILLPAVSPAAENEAEKKNVPDGQPPKVITPADLKHLRPSEEQLLSDAKKLQEARHSARAINVLLDLLRFYPESERNDEALFRIAESYRRLGRFKEARESISLLKKKHSASPWIARAFLLEGEMLASEKKWADAIPLLERGTNVKDHELQQRAHYIALIAYEQTNNLKAAGRHLAALSKSEKDNPHYFYARLKQGILDTRLKKFDEARKAFDLVLNKSAEADLRSEAGVRAGNIAYQQKKFTDARGNFEVVRRTEGPEFWKKLAHLGLIQSQFALQDYKGVIATFNEVKPVFPDEALGQVFFLLAESYRLEKKTEDALTQYEFVLKNFGDSDFAESSAWSRILLLRQKKDPRFIEQTGAFIQKFPESEKKFLAMLMRADAYYEKKEYKTAAPMYRALLEIKDRVKELKEQQQAGLWFRWGHSALLSENPNDASKAFEHIVTKHSEVKFLPTVLWLCGQAHLQTDESQKALMCWQRLVKQFPKEKNREDILWCAGMLAGSLKNFEVLKDMLQALIAEFPVSEKAADAHHWLAVAVQQLGEEDEAISYWRTARDLNKEKYYETATQQIIRHAVEKQSLQELIDEVDAYDNWRIDHPKAPPVSENVYAWIAQELSEGKNPEKSERYYRKVLALSQDADKQRAARLGIAKLMSKLGNHGAALLEWQEYTKAWPEHAKHNVVLENLVIAYKGSAKFSEAMATAEQLLKQNPQGEWGAKARLLMADVYFGQRDYRESAKLYKFVARMPGFSKKEEFAARALDGAEKSYRELGIEELADEMLLQLNKKFPNYRRK